MISLHEIDFSNRNFWVGYIATSFPTALEEEADMSLTELMTENGMCDASWWDNFTKYYDGVLEKSEARRKIICKRFSTKSRMALWKQSKVRGRTPCLPVIPAGGVVCAPLAA